MQDMRPGSLSGLQSGMRQAKAKVDTVIFGVEDFPDFCIVACFKRGYVLQLL